MADIPLDDVYVRAARRLKVIAASEPLSAEDRKVFADYYGSLYAMLEARGVAVWPPDADIPDLFVQPVRDLLAEQAAGDFGVDFTAPWALPALVDFAKPEYTYDETRFMDF